MNSESSKNFSAGVVERNKNSPFQILDVRSINGETSSFHYPPEVEDSGAMSDASSGSEKALVIDMADELEEHVNQRADEPEPKTVRIVEKKDPPKKEPVVAANVRKERINRRKSQHVPLAPDGFMFGLPLSSLPKEKVEDLQDEESLNVCKNIMKHNVLLRNTINHILEQRFERNFNFEAAGTNRSSFDQLRRWVSCYEKIKKESAAEKALKDPTKAV